MLALVGTTACLDSSASTLPPRGQIVLQVDTDAPVVSESPQRQDFGAPIPLFDRIRFDLLPSAKGACDTCTQDFAVSSELFAAGKVSIGVPIPPGDAGWQARVRLYPRRLEQPDGNPDPGTAIDVTVALPAVGATGITAVSVSLSSDQTGQPAGQDTPVAPGLMGTSGPSAVGTWSGAHRTSCSGPTPTGMVCAPGGAFWMGAPVDHAVPNTDPQWHRLVVLAPFFLDETEVTVGTWRVLDSGDPGVALWSGSGSGTSHFDWCNGTTVSGVRDPLPLNCITALSARQYCQALGGDLPTEAEIEYVMGGLRMTPFPWGTELPQCADAVWGRNGAGITAALAPEGCRKSSKALGALGGPEAPGWGARDGLLLPGGKVVDLAGNVGEWARDRYQLSTEPCWSPAGVLHDPDCESPSPSSGSLDVFRGGTWQGGGTSLEATTRVSTVPRNVNPDVGWRCMRRGT